LLVNDDKTPWCVLGQGNARALLWPFHYFYLPTCIQLLYLEGD
jgi:hypothetical protein